MRFTNFFGLGYSVQFKCACSEEEQNQFDRKENKEVTISVVFLFNYKISEIKNEKIEEKQFNQIMTS